MSHMIRGIRRSDFDCWVKKEGRESNQLGMDGAGREEGRN
jgi:hypothetical protein